ncbi:MULTISPECIES: RBBP9/YdeN family alpha/beta hydrolase [Giesbergeria]|uniref:RBBP9/YdeN family alpha/beta hydrolase n=1 Tax=Giesbergeria sinuosa TaxID=80883 RepID=A0ABV9QDV7_9BURK
MSILPRILTLPGWQNSGPDHWQSRWEHLHGYERLEQHDWQRPLRGDWSARLQEVVVDSPGPVLLVAHSLACILVAWWAAHSPDACKVQGALLVAPPDVERTDLRQPLPGWAPIARQPLPFPAVLVASRNDPYGSSTHAQALADAWGAGYIDVGERGHLNAESGLGDWPEGLALLHTLIATKDKA